MTNIEPDHLEFWGGWDQLRQGFADFLAGTDGPRLVCVDDPEAAALARSVGADTYGVHPGATYRIGSFGGTPGTMGTAPAGDAGRAPGMEGLQAGSFELDEVLGPQTSLSHAA